MNSLSRDADAEHGVKDRFVGDAVNDEKDFTVEACLQTVNVLPPPQTRHDDRRADVDQE